MEIKLTNVRICYAQNLFTPSAFEEGKPKKYGAQFVIPKNDKQVQAIQKAIMEVAKVKWQDKADGVIKSINGTDFLCLRDGDKKPDRDEVQDCFYVDAKNKVQPLLVDNNKTRILTDNGRIYSGCYVNAKIDIYAYELNSKKMICAELMGVQFAKDGDAFAGAAKIAKEDDFDDIADTGDDPFGPSTDSLI